MSFVSRALIVVFTIYIVLLPQRAMQLLEGSNSRDNNQCSQSYLAKKCCGTGGLRWQSRRPIDGGRWSCLWGRDWWSCWLRWFHRFGSCRWDGILCFGRGLRSWWPRWERWQRRCRSYWKISRKWWHHQRRITCEDWIVTVVTRWSRRDAGVLGVTNIGIMIDFLLTILTAARISTGLINKPTHRIAAPQEEEHVKAARRSVEAVSRDLTGPDIHRLIRNFS